LNFTVRNCHQIDEIKKIVALTMKGLIKRLSEKKIGIEITDEAMNLISNESYDDVYGARPVKRYVQKHIENEIASMIVKEDVHSGETIKIDKSNDSKLKFSVK